MNKEISIEYYNNLFDNYTQSNLSIVDESLKDNFKLKIFHCKNVQFNCKNIALSENLDNEKLFIAELCGLFHDIGRFKQYVKYKTFRDNHSVYHGQLGLEVLNENKFLERLSEYTVSIVLQSVYNHGLFKILSNTEGELLYFSKLVRDADKIDIFRIVSEYHQKESARNIAFEYGLQDIPVVSDSIMNYFENKELIPKKEVKTLNDFKVMQMSWIFDINFSYSVNVIKEIKYLDFILSTITDKYNKNRLKKVIYSEMF